MNSNVSRSAEQKLMLEKLLAQSFAGECFMVSCTWWNKLLASLSQNLPFSCPIDNLDLV